MTSQVAVKRLAAVEIDPGSSHQHEFNAGKLRTGLGFGTGPVSGTMTATYYGAASDPDADATSGRYTLYDARASHAKRSEYRLYYNTSMLTKRACPGDLLVLFRSPDSNDLSAVVAREGSEAERMLLDAIFVDDRPALDSFRLATPPIPTEDQAERLISAMAPPTPLSQSYGAIQHPLYESALANNKLPSTGAMAKAASELAHGATGGWTSPDDQLDRGLAAETELFYAITDELGERKLATLVADNTGFRAVAAYVAGMKQAAKSRRGTSLQNHFIAVLEQAQIPYTPQCETEPGERPDFIVPGCDQYHDMAYPASQLRMIACKSTAKERWRQVLNEATRIREKHLLTLDPGLSDETVGAMIEDGIRPVLPQSILDDHYSQKSSRLQLRNVEELISELQGVI
jgi:EcoRII C terminal